VKRPGSIRNMQQYTQGSTRLWSRSCDVESVVVHLQLNEAEIADAEPAVAKSEWSSMRPGETFNRTAFKLSLLYSGAGKVVVLPAQEFARRSLQFTSASREGGRPALATPLSRWRGGDRMYLASAP
jgi:hypothetical protein